MSSEHIHIVVGVQGEYSDRSEWEVAAYWDRQLAEEHAEKAKRAANAIYEQEQAIIDAGGMPEYRDGGTPYDPGVHGFYGDTEYHVVTLPVLRTVPTESRPLVRDQQEGDNDG